MITLNDNEIPVTLAALAAYEPVLVRLLEEEMAAEWLIAADKTRANLNALRRLIADLSR